MRILLSLVLLLINVAALANRELSFEMTGQDGLQYFSLSDDALRLNLPGENYYLYQYPNDKLFLVIPSLKGYQLVPKKSVIEQSREQIKTLSKNYDETISNPNVVKSLGSAMADVEKLIDFDKMNKNLDELEEKQKKTTAGLNQAEVVVAKKARRVGGVKCIENSIDQPSNVVKMCLASYKDMKLNKKEIDTYNAYERYMKAITGVVSPEISSGQFIVTNEIYEKKKRANGTFLVNRRPVTYLRLKSNINVEHPSGHFLIPENFKVLNLTQ